MRKLLVLFCILINFYANAYRYALTKSRQTIVYADVHLKAPIGFIRSGRKIKVGDNSLKKDTIVPLVVSGKIAYVKTSDITFSISGSEIQSRAVVENHDIEKVFETDADKLKANSHITFDYGFIVAGSDWQAFHDKYEPQEVPGMHQFMVSIEHRDPENRSGFKFGLGYLSASSGASDLSSFFAEIQYQYRLISRSSYAIELFGGFIFTGDFTQENYGQSSAGSAWGYDFGARLRFAPFSRFGFFFDAGLEVFNTADMDIIVTDVVSSVGGPYLGGGFSIKF